MEVYVRSRLAYELSHLQGPFGYMDRTNLPGLSDDEYDSFISKARQCFARCREPFADHFRKKYGDSHDLPPYWIIVETFDFGLISKLYKGAPKSVRKTIANGLGVQMPVMTSWLHAVNTVRNMCAHHARLWNKILGYKPTVPKDDALWSYVREHNDKIFAILTILNYMLTRIAPDTKWKSRLIALLEEYPGIDICRMGFPEDWQSDPLWRNESEAKAVHIPKALEYARVKTLVNKEGFPVGSIGVVVGVYGDGPGCEVEIWDENNYPIDVVTYDMSELEVLH